MYMKRCLMIVNLFMLMFATSGISMKRLPRVYACESCHKDHARCSQNRPCERCTNRDRECVERRRESYKRGSKRVKVSHEESTFNAQALGLSHVPETTSGMPLSAIDNFVAPQTPPTSNIEVVDQEALGEDFTIGNLEDLIAFLEGSVPDIWTDSEPDTIATDNNDQQVSTTVTHAELYAQQVSQGFYGEEEEEIIQNRDEQSPSYNNNRWNN